ncbi:MAG: hypothetical protein ACRD8A_20125 [Candidatus Acidiferrales bacterium]
MTGLWQPTIGAGASYDVKGDGQSKQPFELAIIGSENVEGKNGVWVEFTIGAEQIGTMIVKELVLFDAAKMQMQTYKAVIELPGHPPMDLPDEMMQAQQPFRFNDVRAESADLGSERVTTLAGTFACEHYRAKDGSSEFWVSKQVLPMGLVKSQGKGQTVTLVKLVKDAKDKISGTTQPFDPMMFMPQRPQQ